MLLLGEERQPFCSADKHLPDRSVGVLLWPLADLDDAPATEPDFSVPVDSRPAVAVTIEAHENTAEAARCEQHCDVISRMDIEAQKVFGAEADSLKYGLDFGSYVGVKQ